MSKPHAIIIGGGFTGLATAHDLCLRGFDVAVVDRGDLISGTSGDERKVCSMLEVDMQVQTMNLPKSV